MIIQKTLTETVLLSEGSKIIVGNGNSQRFCTVCIKRNGQRMTACLDKEVVNELIEALKNGSKGLKDTF